MPVIETINQPVVVEATGVPEVVEFTESQVTIEAPVTQVTVDFPGSARLIAGEGLEGGGLMQGDVDISLSAAALASLDLADSAVQPGDDVSDLTNDADYQSGAQVTAAINALGTVYQPLDADLSAVAALSSLGLVARTAAGTFATRTLTGVTNQTDVTNGNGVAGNPTVGLAAAVLASLALANSAVQPGGPVSDFTNDVGYQTYGQVLVLISSAGAGYQPLDSDLTAIAALGTTSFGRGLLTLADAAATKALLDLEIGMDLQAYSSNLDLWSALAPSAKQDVSAKLTAYAGGDTPSAFTLGIVDSADAAAWRTALAVYNTTETDAAIAAAVAPLPSTYQPLDADLTAIAALTTTTFGRSLLTLADAAAVRAVLDLEVGTDVQAYSAVLDAYAATTPDAYSLDLLSLDSAGAWRAAIGAGVPYTANALTRTNDTNITLTLGGTPATALLQAVSMTLGWTGTLAKDRGGFGEDASALTTTIAELNYVDGVTSNIQTQLDAKQAHSTVLDDWALGPSPSAFTLSLVNLTNASDWWVAIGAGVPTYDAGSGLDFTAGIFSIDYTYTGYWQAPIGFDNQDTATVDEIFWAMRVVDDPGIWSFYAQSDDGSTRANFLAVTRGTGVSVVSMEYGNATDAPGHTFYGIVYTNVFQTRIIQNGGAGITSDGLYIGYGNVSSGDTRLYGGGNTATPVTITNGGTVEASGSLISGNGTVHAMGSTQPTLYTTQSGTGDMFLHDMSGGTARLFVYDLSATAYRMGMRIDVATGQVVLADTGVTVVSAGPTIFPESAEFGGWAGSHNAAYPIRIGTTGGYSYVHAYDGSSYTPLRLVGSTVGIGAASMWVNFTSTDAIFETQITTGAIAGTQSTPNASSLEIRNNGGTGDSNLAAISFHCQSQFGVHLHLRADGVFGLGGWSANSWVWYVNTTTGDMSFGGTMLFGSVPAARIDSGTLASARLDPSDGAWGVRTPHSTYTAFDDTASGMTHPYGSYYIQGTGNGPGGSGEIQYYMMRLGIGSDYIGQYAMDIAVPRIPAGGLPYIYLRFWEGGGSGAWTSARVRDSDFSQRLWSVSHTGTYYMEMNWDGTYWNLTTNHGSPVRVGYADNAGAGGGGILYAAKTSTTSRNSTTSPTADPALQLTGVAAGTYEIELLTSYSQNSGSSQGITLQIAGTNLTVQVISWELQNTGTAPIANFQAIYRYAQTSGTAQKHTASTSISDSIIRMKGIVTLSGTGTIEFRWAQASSSGNNTNVGAYGALTAVKIA